MNKVMRAGALCAVLATWQPLAAQAGGAAVRYQARTIVRHGGTLAAAADPPGCQLPRSTPAAEGVDAAAVDSLVRLARAANSDALVILKNGRVVVEWYPDGPREPVELMSVTKVLAGLAVGRLLDAGRIASLDEPVATFYPEWRQGRKRRITLRHLLTHTSGLQDVPNAGVELEPSPDVLRLALAAELSAEPGSHFEYSNKAVNLLPGIVEEASGLPLDRFLGETVFRDLCITDFGWMYDPAGRPFAMGGAQLHARDLARIGQMMLADGQWGGTRVLSREWVQGSVRPSQTLYPMLGLLWFLSPEWVRHSLDPDLLAQWRAAGVDGGFVQRVTPLAGREYTPESWVTALDSIFGAGRGRSTWLEALHGKVVPGRRTRAGRVRGFYHTGYLGQYLVVVPESGVVAVRLIRRRAAHAASDEMRGFESLVMSLLGPRPADTAR